MEGGWSWISHSYLEYQSSKSKVVTTLEDGRLCGWFVEVCPSPQDHGLDPVSSEGLYGGEVNLLEMRPRGN